MLFVLLKCHLINFTLLFFQSFSSSTNFAETSKLTTNFNQTLIFRQFYFKHNPAFQTTVKKLQVCFSHFMENGNNNSENVAKRRQKKKRLEKWTVYIQNKFGSHLVCCFGLEYSTIIFVFLNLTELTKKKNYFAIC